MKNNKIAICISGQTRTAIEAYPIFKNFFDGCDVDIFIHTWTKTSNKLKNNSIEVFDVDIEVFEKINELYNPKKILIEPPLEKIESFAPWTSMFYSMMISNKLRLDYEIETDVNYETVIKYRFDLAFSKEMKFPKNMMKRNMVYYLYGDQGHLCDDCGFHGLNDLIFWGDPQTMTILMDTYRYYKFNLVKKINNILSLSNQFNTDSSELFQSPGQIIYKRAIQHNINPVDLSLTGYQIHHSIWRMDVCNLNPFTDYELIHKRNYG